MRSQFVAAALGTASLAFGQEDVPREAPEVYGGGLTILAQNELTNDPRKDSAAVLAHDWNNYLTFEKACQLLGEVPLDPTQIEFEAGLNSSLSYQVYLGNFDKGQEFWVAKEAEDSKVCRIITTEGELRDVNCDVEIPGLCTQSAPVSTSGTNDDPTDFHVSQTVGDNTYVGFRDFFTFKFRGIRYAAQPERFEHSTVFTPEESLPIPAFKAGAECLQRIGEVREGMDEDCLFLNVWTPTLPALWDGAPRWDLKPVMFYIYGGGLTSGSGKNPNTDGTGIASRGDVVAVSINYRVSNLGFLTFDDGEHNGNYGLGDVVTALEWVKENIASFGGDASRITIYGESAGAVLVRALLASPRAQGLFTNAISQSGPAGLVNNEHGYVATYDSVGHVYEHITKGVLEETGCNEAEDAIACLREYNATELVYLNNVASGVVVDGEYIDAVYLALDGSGLTANVTFMTGTNRDELGVDFAPIDAEDAILSRVVSEFEGRWGRNLTGVLPSGPFPLAEEPTAADILDYTIRIGTDGLYTCMEQATNHAAAKGGAFKNLYAFQFNRTYNPSGYTQPHCGPAATDEFPDGDPSLEYKKCHAGEQMIVFGTVRRGGLPDRDGLDVPFSQLVMDYWTSLAHTGDPNPNEAYLEARGYWSTLEQVRAVGGWKAAAAGEPNLMNLQWDGGHEALPERDQCDALGIELDFWDGFE
ncbi:unnamed protein product [Parascedosporium putredinis]|uniref:Carboxylic ester hydrolase n=1 Tax=Parascedosporium putredinis TaxID=1442378 RepID=A0A9P1GYF5_9PEZI|nr:unnamed protein product [Parascedosporium putredinis]CAI7990704.1 unnamed protein product [Parascedosporium putredinis]